MKPSTTIFVSSTVKDLKKHRRQVFELFHQMQMRDGRRIHPIATEISGADNAPAMEACIKRIQGSGVVILIVGFCYGTLVPEDKIGRSYTEIEYDEAIKAEKPLLVFLAEDRAAFSRSIVDESFERIDSFRKKIMANQSSQHLIRKFGSQKDFQAGLLETVQTTISILMQTSIRIRDIPRQDVRLKNVICHNFTGMTDQVLFGREDELKKLDDWLVDVHMSACLIEAEGGMGKTSLAWEWLNNSKSLKQALSRKSNSSFKIAGTIWWSCYEHGATLFALGRTFREWIESSISREQHINEADNWLAISQYIRDLRHPLLVIVDGLEAEFISYDQITGVRRNEHKKRIGADFTAAGYLGYDEDSNSINDEENSKFHDFYDKASGKMLAQFISNGQIKILYTSRHSPQAFFGQGGAISTLISGLEIINLDILSKTSAKQAMLEEYGDKDSGQNVKISGSETLIDDLLKIESLRHPLLLSGFIGSVVADPVANGNIDIFLEENSEIDMRQFLKVGSKRRHILLALIHNLTPVELELMHTIATMKNTPARLAIASVSDRTKVPQSDVKKSLFRLEYTRRLIHRSRQTKDAQVYSGQRMFTMHPVYRTYFRNEKLGEIRKSAQSMKDSVEHELFEGVGRDQHDFSRRQLDERIIPYFDLSIDANDLKYSWVTLYPFLEMAKEQLGLYQLAFDRIQVFIQFISDANKSLRAYPLLPDNLAIDLLHSAGELFRLFDAQDKARACFEERRRLLNILVQNPNTSQNEFSDKGVAIINAKIRVLSNQLALWLTNEKFSKTSDTISAGMDILEEYCGIRVEIRELDSIYSSQVEDISDILIVVLSRMSDNYFINSNKIFRSLSSFQVLKSWDSIGANLASWHQSNIENSLIAERNLESAENCIRKLIFVLRNTKREKALAVVFLIKVFLSDGRHEIARKYLNEISSEKYWKYLDFQELGMYYNLYIDVLIAENEGRSHKTEINQAIGVLEEIYQYHKHGWGHREIRAHLLWILRLTLVAEDIEKSNLLFTEILKICIENEIQLSPQQIEELRNCADKIGRSDELVHIFNENQDNEIDIDLNRIAGYPIDKSRCSPAEWA